VTLSITVNQRERQVDAGPNKPLLWILREDLGLRGTKFGCGVGQCGACTVLLDGKAVRSCQTLLSDAAGHSVTTIEHVATLPAGKRLVDAWIDIDVPQCGYCQAGQIMSATGLLSATPQPDDGAIEAAMKGNICRCSTYLRIRRAIRQAAGLEKAGAAA